MEKIKINPGNCVKLKNGIIALVDENNKLIDIKAGRIVSDLKKFDKNFANIPLNKVGENRFDIEIVYKNIKLDNIIYIVKTYNKDLIKHFINKDFCYFYRDEKDNYFVSREEPVILEHYFQLDGKEHIYTEIATPIDTTFNVTILVDLIPNIEQNTYENFKNFIEEE